MKPGALATLPVLGPLLVRAKRWLDRRRFRGPTAYWERRYARGGDSGPGSYGALAAFKADVINGLVREHGLRSVVEFGCGDGNQLGLAEYPDYTGWDVSATAVAACRARFAGDATKRFELLEAGSAPARADLALSLDVIYHLVDDAVFERHMAQLFGAARSHVVIYSSDRDDNDPLQAVHVRHRRFTRWIAAHARDWTLERRIPNPLPFAGDLAAGSHSDFYVYRRAPSSTASNADTQSDHA